MKRNLIIRIVAIFLCALMVLSVVTAALYAFAAESTAPAFSPETGSSDAVVWVIVAIAIAVIAISVCLISQRKK